MATNKKFCLHCIIYIYTNLYKSSLLLALLPCYLVSVCWYGWSNWDVSLTHFTIRTVLRDHMYYWATKQGDLGALNHYGYLNWMRDLIWRREPQTPLHTIFVKNNNTIPKHLTYKSEHLRYSLSIFLHPYNFQVNITNLLWITS